MNKKTPDIRPAAPQDHDDIWNILRPVIREGKTYTFPIDMTREAALKYWFSPSHQVFIARDGFKTLGTYYLRPNQTGGGDHVANCGYVTAPEARGKGIARAMCTHSQEIAKSHNFTAMQFNFVIATNMHAIHLWQKLGFETVGTLPKAFNHPTLGFVDALIMHKQLS